MGYVRGESRGQVALFPRTLEEVVPDDHVCRVIEAFVDGLDLLGLGFGRAATAVTGRPPYDPADLLKLYVYGYLHRVRSSRRLEAECRRNVEVMWLLGRLIPDHKTIAEFRRTEGEGLKSVCAGFVSFLREAGLVRGEWVAIDGSKFQAVASGKSVPSIEALQRQVEQYLQSLEQADASEVDAEAVPPAMIQAALSKLQAARTAGPNRPLSEPEARLMRGQDGPCYNVQTAVDSECGVIVTHEVTDEATDNRSLQPIGPPPVSWTPDTLCTRCLSWSSQRCQTARSGTRRSSTASWWSCIGRVGRSRSCRVNSVSPSGRSLVGSSKPLGMPAAVTVD